jgi:methyl-accepting chemotaxis protein
MAADVMMDAVVQNVASIKPDGRQLCLPRRRRRQDHRPPGRQPTLKPGRARPGLSAQALADIERAATARPSA